MQFKSPRKPATESERLQLFKGDPPETRLEALRILTEDRRTKARGYLFGAFATAVTTAIALWAQRFGFF